MNRRNFVRNMATSASGIILGNALVQNAVAATASPAGPADRMKEVLRYRKLDAHVHLGLSKDGPEVNVDFAERLGIDRMFISKPVTSGPATPDDFRAANDVILKAMKRYPGKLTGMLTLNPAYPKASLEEIKRCTGEGMTGIKVYHQVKINDPLFYPVIERLIDLKMIMLMHAEATLGIAGYRMKYDQGIKPNASRPEDFVEAAARYPEAMLQYAHIGGGPDWEYACKLLKNSPNVYIDVSGSNNENNMVEFAVKCVGADRILFGSDNMYYQSVGKIIDARLTEEEKRKIFFDNYYNILKKGGYHVD
ncbi:amidohydrolase family protein [Chitinophaga sp. XS-30]|uniref:amidohydrolase family protein n=1 Tax=Chitinophaga sp. XS-30 TaxID=2604421 RepID=UPI0011DCC84C|nr:amidohydrolase family protein [Chitinophaga sp. XS-30]QEH41845.1 amidohydrolase family protein [Chitinophaga sp. XS-30]